MSFGKDDAKGERDDENEEDLVRHVIENQIEPQLRAREFGEGALAPLVYTGEQKIEGSTTLTCVGCGKTAQLVGLSPEEAASLQDKAPLCPSCMRDRLDRPQEGR